LSIAVSSLSVRLALSLGARQRLSRHFVPDGVNCTNGYRTPFNTINRKIRTLFRILVTCGTATRPRRSLDVSSFARLIASNRRRH
jgi:hypothetical protein